MINIAHLTTGLATKTVSKLLEAEINIHRSTLQKTKTSQDREGIVDGSSPG